MTDGQAGLLSPTAYQSGKNRAKLTAVLNLAGGMDKSAVMVDQTVWGGPAISRKQTTVVLSGDDRWRVIHQKALQVWCDVIQAPGRTRAVLAVHTSCSQVGPTPAINQTLSC